MKPCSTYIVSGIQNIIAAMSANSFKMNSLSAFELELSRNETESKVNKNDDLNEIQDKRQALRKKWSIILLKFDQAYIKSKSSVSKTELKLFDSNEMTLMPYASVSAKRDFIFNSNIRVLLKRTFSHSNWANSKPKPNTSLPTPEAN